jgi:hypothetical protein
MTSNSLQARYAYTPTEMSLNRTFTAVPLQTSGSDISLDMSRFDDTCTADLGLQHRWGVGSHALQTGATAQAWWGVGSLAL